VNVRNRLVLLFFAITSAAVVFVYLYVVPQLRTSLTAEKLSRQELAVSSQVERLQAAIEENPSQQQLRRLVRRMAQESGTRMTLLGVRPSGGDGDSAFVIADSELEPSAVLPSYLVAARAASSDQLASGVEGVGARRLAETAAAVRPEGEPAGGPAWVAVASSPLDDVDDNVDLIQRQILIAGSIAIGLASVAGFVAAGGHSRRLRRLEEAAEQVAEGNFSYPIPIESSDEVGQLAVALNEMQRRLERLDSARKEFIANASHELRTPIFSLGGFVELLETDDPDPASRQEFVRTMRGQVDRLTKLATDLLDLSKLDVDALTVQRGELDLTNLAAEISEEFQATARQHSSQLDLVGDPGHPVVADADPVRVAQILRILLDNALKHTPEGTAIKVRTTRQGSRTRLVVSDDGPGFDSAVAEQVFERFYTGTETSGSGLGLAIAQELAVLMDGELRVSSGPGGTDFTLELPARSAANAEGAWA
jgi:signal transduction histidine kinase